MNSPRTNRVLQILALVSSNRTPTQLKEITAALGVHPSMVSRMTADLIEAGLLTKVTYRSVIAAPALALLGQRAAKNHPAAQLALPMLRAKINELGYSCEFATLTPMGLYRFYHVLRETPATQVPLWRSDTAAVCMAAGKSKEECLEYLAELKISEKEIAFFMERFETALQVPVLLNRHQGRFWQATAPVICGDLACALSFSGVRTAEIDKGEFETARMAAEIRSAYKEFAKDNA